MVVSYDTQRVGGEMINAIVAQEIKRQKTAREAELEQTVNDLQMQLDLRKQHDAKLYTRFVDDDRRRYSYEHNDGVLATIWWALVGWTVLAVGALIDLVRV